MSYLNRRNALRVSGLLAAGLILPAEWLIYLPLLAGGKGDAAARFGVQHDMPFGEGMLPYIVSNRLYHFPVRFADCCQTQGTFQAPQYLLDNIGTTYPARLGMGTLTCPDWARLWPECLGSPPAREFWGDFADFVCRAIDICPGRWQYVELWNEPDVPIEIVGEHDQNYLGAWVRGGDYKTAGRMYGEFVAQAAEIIRQRFLQVRIYAGALVSDGERSLEFLRAAASSGIEAADGISYHIYQRPPVYNFKAISEYGAAIRGIIAKPLAVTETSIRDNNQAIDLKLLNQAQVDYWKYLMHEVQESGIEILNWYSWGQQWENTAMWRNEIAMPIMTAWMNGL